MDRLTAKQVGVLAAMTVLAGCATREQVVTTPQDISWVKVGAKARANAKPAPEPKLLPMTHFSAGQLFEQRGELANAVEQYRRAVALNRTFVQAYNRLGIVLDRLGQYEAADEALVEAIKLQPDAAYLRNNLAFSYMLQGRWAAAEAELRNAVQLKPSFARARLNLAVALAKQGRSDEALEQFCQVLPPATAYYNIGLLCRSEKRYAEARQALQKALSLDDRMAAALVQLYELEAMGAGAPPANPEPDAKAVVLPVEAEQAAHQLPVQEAKIQVDEPAAAEAPLAADGLDQVVAADGQAQPYSVRPLLDVLRPALELPAWQRLMQTVGCRVRQGWASWVERHDGWVEPVLAACRPDPQLAKVAWEKVIPSGS